MFTREDDDQCKLLAECFEAGTVKGSFAASVLSQYADRGSLSPKQMIYVRKMVAEAQGVREEKVSAAPKGSTGEVVNCHTLKLLFRSAKKAKVQYPSITYVYPNFGTIRVFLADNGQDIIFINHINRTRYGWIDGLADELKVGPLAAVGTIAYNYLRKIITDPIGSAVVSGKETGNCMFCGKTLNNEFSVDHGYGPICATNYGLPWQVGKHSKVISMQAGDLLASLGDEQK